MGRDASCATAAAPAPQFQSTRPVWGATPADLTGKRGNYHFNPRAPYGARPVLVFARLVILQFQSTRPVWGATAPAASFTPRTGDFNPRAPYGARHNLTVHYLYVLHFNPRAPYGARQRTHDRLQAAERNFNPRAPYGARPKTAADRARDRIFQSTRPVWGATGETPRRFKF